MTLEGMLDGEDLVAQQGFAMFAEIPVSVLLVDEDECGLCRGR